MDSRWRPLFSMTGNRHTFPMAPKRTGKIPSGRSSTRLERGYRAYDQYRELYPSLPGRVSDILESEIPFVRERIGDMRARAARQSEERATGFAKRFQLTPAEARIAVFLGEGGTVAGFAKAHRTSPATVRSHLKAIFRKTGAKRQADLVTLLHKPLGFI